MEKTKRTAIWLNKTAAEYLSRLYKLYGGMKDRCKIIETAIEEYSIGDDELPKIAKYQNRRAATSVSISLAARAQINSLANELGIKQVGVTQLILHQQYEREKTRIKK